MTDTMWAAIWLVTTGYMLVFVVCLTRDMADSYDMHRRLGSNLSVGPLLVFVALNVMLVVALSRALTYLAEVFR